LKLIQRLTVLREMRGSLVGRGIPQSLIKTQQQMMQDPPPEFFYDVRPKLRCATKKLVHVAGELIATLTTCSLVPKVSNLRQSPDFVGELSPTLHRHCIPTLPWLFSNTACISIVYFKHNWVIDILRVNLIYFASREEQNSSYRRTFLTNTSLSNHEQVRKRPLKLNKNLQYTMKYRLNVHQEQIGKFREFAPCLPSITNGIRIGYEFETSVIPAYAVGPK
jgi:hypothetical protein